MLTFSGPENLFCLLRRLKEFLDSFPEIIPAESAVRFFKLFQVQFRCFVWRRGLSLPVRDPGYVAVECPNVDSFLFLPVAAGCWQQHELWDGTYTLDDLLDIAELIRVQRENENRAEDTARQG